MLNRIYIVIGVLAILALGAAFVVPSFVAWGDYRERLAEIAGEVLGAPVRIEGDIQQMPADFAVTELWEVLNGSRTGRDSDVQITVFDSVGFALEDFSALRFMRDAALALGYGERLALIPQLANPKNLFGILAQHDVNVGPASSLFAKGRVLSMSGN